jgi:penicillin amidase
MQSIQNDYYSLLCADFQPIARRLSPQTADGLLWQAAISGWDCNTAPSPGASAATQFALWYSQLSTLAAAETNTSHWNNAVYLLRVFNSSNSAADPNCARAPALYRSTVPAHLTLSEPLTCLQWAAAALDTVATASGSSVGGWGEAVHHAYFQHPVLSGSPIGCLSDRSTPHGGDGSTVNVGSYDMSDKGLAQMDGPSYRQVIDLSNFANSRWMLPLGQSGNLLSELYDNMLPKWSNAQYLPFNTDPQSFSTKHTLTLAPL